MPNNNKQILKKKNPEEVLEYLIYLDSMDSSSFIEYYNYFLEQSTKNDLSNKNKWIMANTLYYMKLEQKENDNSRMEDVICLSYKMQLDAYRKDFIEYIANPFQKNLKKKYNPNN